MFFNPCNSWPGLRKKSTTDLSTSLYQPAAGMNNMLQIILFLQEQYYRYSTDFEEKTLLTTATVKIGGGLNILYYHLCLLKHAFS